MKAVGVADFKEQCMELLDKLDDHGLVIAKDRKPVAVVIPHNHAGAEWRLAVLDGSLRDKIKIKGDIFSTGIQWDAQS